MITSRYKYICPMHPDVASDDPGRCGKCGMELIQDQTGRVVSGRHLEIGESDKYEIKDYVPLIVIVLMIISASIVVELGRGIEIDSLLINIMIGFFLVFGAFKLFDLSGFARAYDNYDLLARKWTGYGYVYPFLELVFGLLMLAGIHTDALLWSEFALMGFSGAGVWIKLHKKEKFECACLGTFLKVPLTYVSLIEDFAMAALALILIAIM